MVIITRSAYRKATQSINSSDISQNNIIAMPPWCSSGKVYKRREPRKALPPWETQTSYPLRGNIWEYLNDNSSYSNDAQKTHKKKIKEKIIKCNTRKLVTVFICLLIGLSLILPFLSREKIPNKALLKSVLQDIGLSSVINLHSTSVSEECCEKLKHLTLALSRIEQEWRNSVRSRRKFMLSSPRSITKTNINNSFAKYLVHGSRAIKGSRTTEWGTQVALWGVLPLWRTAPPPDTVLALRQPKPSDCWPFGGSYGEIIIELPRKMSVSSLSLEHIRPDTARSAPKNFVVYGVLENGTYVKAADGTYQYNKPAKQYFSLNNSKAPLRRVVFRVLSNQGNMKYTCIYRIQMYRSDDTFIY